MIARAALALLALAAHGPADSLQTRAQSSSIWVDVAPNTEDPVLEDRRYTPELVTEYNIAKEDASALYTEFQGHAAVHLKAFLRNMTGLTNETISALDWGYFDSAPESCKSDFKKRLRKIEFDSHLSATFSAENHHKFFLGHMIVFRMHLNKSEDYIRKCDKIVQACGTRCESTQRMNRWRRLAVQEIHRVRDDINHTRRSYRDLLAHALRRLRTLRRQALAKAKNAVETLQVCVRDG